MNLNPFRENLQVKGMEPLRRFHPAYSAPQCGSLGFGAGTKKERMVPVGGATQTNIQGKTEFLMVHK